MPRASVASRLLDQSGLVEQFVAVEHALLVPMRALGAEIQPHADRLRPSARAVLGSLGLLPPSRVSSGRCRARSWPGRASRQSSHGKKRYQGSNVAPARALRVVGRARQREIADRGDMCVGVAGLRVPAAIAEGVELLDIAEPQVRPALPPRRAARSRRCGARPRRTGRTASPASLSPSLPDAVRISGSLPSIATMAAVRPISIGVRGLSLIWRRSRASLEIDAERPAFDQSCCPDPSRRARAASAPRAPAPCPPG